MDEDELAPHVEDISSALEGAVDEDEILKELKSYLKLYRVSLESAKRGIVRKFGGDPSKLSKGQRKKIEDLGLNEQSVDLLARVVTVNKRDIESDGETKPILYGIFGDETGTVPYTAWEAEKFDFKKGDVYLINNAYTTEWNEEPQVNLGNRVSVEKRDPDSLPLPESGSSFSPAEEKKIAQLRDGMGNVIVTGRILTTEEREVNVSGEPKTIYSGLMADSSGKVQYTAWVDFSLEEREVVKIENAYVKSWRGIPQLNFGERSELSRPDVDLPPAKELQEPNQLGIDELDEIGGGVDVLVQGVVVDIKKGSGLIFRCPECRRPVQGGSCRVHGKVDANPDLRVKAVLDDGNSTLTAILNREVTEDLLGITLEGSLNRAKESMDQDVVKKDIEDKMLARPMEMRGNVTSDEYGLMMIVREVGFLKEDVRGKAEALLAELGVES